MSPKIFGEQHGQLAIQRLYSIHGDEIDRRRWLHGRESVPLLALNDNQDVFERQAMRCTYWSTIFVCSRSKPSKIDLKARCISWRVCQSMQTCAQRH